MGLGAGDLERPRIAARIDRNVSRTRAGDRRRAADQPFDDLIAQGRDLLDGEGVLRASSENNSRLARLKPPSRVARFRSVRVSRPAPATRTRKRSVLRPASASLTIADDVDTGPAFSPPVRSTRVAPNAGASPKSSPVSADNASVNVRTAAFGWRSRRIGLGPVSTSPATAAVPKRAMANPRAPPIKASNMLSVRNCRTSRARPAPIDRRIVTSLTRAVPRAEKVGDVRAPDQEHQPDHRHQHVQRQRGTIAQARGAAAGGNHRRADSVPSGQLTQPDIGRLGEKLLERGIDSAARSVRRRT